jgi:hypothetical protein
MTTQRRMLKRGRLTILIRDQIILQYVKQQHNQR